MKKTDVLIIGAGQAGLATGYHLLNTPFRFVIVDGASRVGDSWRKRYDSLLLFTPRSLSALSGLALEGDNQGYASRDEFADYLEAYARHFDLPVELNTGIKRLERANDHFVATSKFGQSFEAQVVILASGGFQKPIIPPMATNLSSNVRQFSAESYKNPSEVSPGNVVVIGDGATGRDIASELAESHTVYLATGKPRRLMPERILGISMWWWLSAFGLLTATPDSFIGRKMRRMDSFPNRERNFAALRHKGIQIMSKLNEVNGNVVTFVNGASIPVNTVVWAMGYQDNSDWVNIPEVKDAHGNFVQKRGVSPAKNLYFVGRPWQTSRASALIYGVGRDAKMIVQEINKNFQPDQIRHLAYPKSASSPM